MSDPYLLMLARALLDASAKEANKNPAFPKDYGEIIVREGRKPTAMLLPIITDVFPEFDLDEAYHLATHVITPVCRDVYAGRMKSPENMRKCQHLTLALLNIYKAIQITEGADPDASDNPTERSRGSAAE